MATVAVSGSITSVANAKYFVRVQLLNSDGVVVTESTSSQFEVTSNPSPTVGSPTVTVS
jgi:hypothetical protein